MLFTFGACLVALFCFIVFFWYCRREINNDFVPARAYFTAAATAKCITNAAWANVLT